MRNFKVLVFVVFMLGCGCSEGQKWSWAINGRDSLDPNYSNSVTLNANGDALFAGYYLGDRIYFSNDSLINTNKYQISNSFLVDYDGAGNVIWARQPHEDILSGGSNENTAVSDKSGNIYWTGRWSSSYIVFGTDTMLEAYPTCIQTFLVKYTPSGSAEWIRQTSCDPSFPSTSIQNLSVGVDNLGNVYSIGLFNGDLHFGPYAVYAPTSDMFFAKYDTNGNLKWVKQPHVSSAFSPCQASGFTLEPTGCFYFTGTMEDTVIFGKDTLKSVGESGFLVKYDSGGNEIWVRKISDISTNYGSVGFGGITEDWNGYLYLTGGFSDTLIIAGDTIRTGNTGNFFYAKYDTAGHLLWLKPGAPLDLNYWGFGPITSNKNGGIFMAGGASTGNQKLPAYYKLAFGNDTLQLNDPYEDGMTFIIKIDTSGKIVCDTVSRPEIGLHQRIT